MVLLAEYEMEVPVDLEGVFVRVARVYSMGLLRGEGRV
jgi:hypothetical protein